MSTLGLGCGLQDNLHSLSTKKNGADEVPFFLKKASARDAECEVREYLERHLTPREIAQRVKVNQDVVDKYISTLRSPL